MTNVSIEHYVLSVGIVIDCRVYGMESCKILKVKGKAVPLQAWSGPEGSRKLRFPDFMTTAQYGGKGKAVPLQASSGPEGSRKLSFPRFHDNDTGWW